MHYQNFADLLAAAKVLLTNSANVADTANWKQDQMLGFVALGYMHVDSKRAKNLFRAIFARQLPNGKLPLQWSSSCDANDTEASSSQLPQNGGLLLPPYLGFILWEMYLSSEDLEEGRLFLKEMYPKVLAAHRYWYKYRDPQGVGLPHVCHPWESLLAPDPAWAMALPDPASSTSYATKSRTLLKQLEHWSYDDSIIYQESPFLLQDPALNAALSWSNEALLQIGGVLQEDITEVLQWYEWTIYSVNEQLWDDTNGWYVGFDLRQRKQVETASIASLLPMIGEIPTQEQAESLLLALKSKRFGGKRKDVFLCPALALDQAVTTEDKNQVSIPLNWMLYRGLLRYDMKKMAARVRQHSLQLMQLHGFCDYFSPTGATIDGPGEPAMLSAAISLDF